MKNIVTVFSLVLISALSVAAQSGTSLGVQQTLSGSPTVLENTSRPTTVIAADPASKEVEPKTESMVLVPLEYLVNLNTTLVEFQSELTRIRRKVEELQEASDSIYFETESIKTVLNRVKTHLTTVLGEDSYNRFLEGGACGSRPLSNFPTHPILCLLERAGR